MEDNHSHCWSCVKLHCTEYTLCPVERCANGCGMSLHRCKWKEHNENICPEAQVNCTNAYYGCTSQMPRKNLLQHIEHCPASLLECRFSYCRKRARLIGDLEEVNYPGALVDEKVLAVDQELSSVDGNASALEIDIENDPHCRILRYSSSVPYNERNRTCKNESSSSTFSCNEIVRRDEFPVHWKSLHIDTQLDSSQCIRRCPLQLYGCTFGQNTLVPSPLGSKVCYNEESDVHSIVPAESCIKADEDAALQPSSYIMNIQKKKELALYGYGDDEEEESFDILGQLPSEVLLVVISFLDSLSLWSLSQVNHYFRTLCYDMVKTKGIVYGQWEKDTNSDLPWVHWIHRPKVSER